MAPIIKDAYYVCNIILESNVEYEDKYRNQASLTEKLLQRTYFHEELHEVLKICLCTFEAKIGLLETLLSEGVMAYGKLIDPEYKYGDEGYDDAEVCFVSVSMLEEALDESKGVRANFDSSEIWNAVRCEVLRIRTQQAAVGAAQIFKQQLEDRRAFSWAKMEELFAE